MRVCRDRWAGILAVCCLGGAFFLPSAPVRAAEMNAPLSENETVEAEAYGRIGAGARAAGMGHALAGLADDASAVFWNPAGLGQLKLIEFAFSHSVLSRDTYYHQAAFVQPLLGVGTVGLGVQAWNDFAGVFDGSESAEVHDTMLTVAYGREMFAGLAIGLGLNGCSLTWGDETTAGIGLDTGLFYRTPWAPLALGVALENVFASTLQLPGWESVPGRRVRGGISLTFLRGALLAAAEGEKALAEESGWVLGAGLEAKPLPFVAVRGGYRDGILTAGLGLDLRDCRLDYAAALDPESNLTHRLSLSWIAGAYTAKVKVDPKMFSRHSLNKTCTFSLDLAERDSIREWELTVRPAGSDKVVRTYTLSEIPETWVWDGKNDQEEFLPEGRYVAEMSGTDEEGNRLRSNLVEVTIMKPVVIQVKSQEEREKEEEGKK